MWASLSVSLEDSLRSLRDGLLVCAKLADVETANNAAVAQSKIFLIGTSHSVVCATATTRATVRSSGKATLLFMRLRAQVHQKRSAQLCEPLSALVGKHEVSAAFVQVDHVLSLQARGEIEPISTPSHEMR